MYEEMRVKYFLVNFKYPTYLKLQIICISSLIIYALLCFLFAGDSSLWFLKNGWWLGIVVGLLEGGESFFAIKKAKRDLVQKKFAH